MLIGICCHHGKELDIINLIARYNQTGFTAGHVVQTAEHGTVIHMVAINHVIGV